MEIFTQNLNNGDKVWICSFELIDDGYKINRKLKPILTTVEITERYGLTYYHFYDDKGKEIKPYGTKRFSTYYMFSSKEEATEKYNELVSEAIEKIEYRMKRHIEESEIFIKKLNQNYL